MSGALCASLSITTTFGAEATLEEVVVTASRDKNPLDIAQPTSVLSGDDLSRQLAGSLGETLSRQLGVSSSYFGPTASRPVIRGLGGYRVQTLQDGLATLDVGSLSDDHAVTIDPALATQLEILKGPATLLYGSGASGGLVNVVTNRIPSAAPKDGLDALIELRAGMVADERAGAASLNAGSEHFAVHVDAFKSKSDAIDIPSATISRRLSDRLIAAGEEPEAHQGSIPNAFSDSKGGAFGASWFGNDTLVGGSASRYESVYGIPSEATAFIDMKQNRYDAKVAWRSSTGWLRGLSVSGAYNDYAH
ncbi:MAG: TonB-dependent receptor plug domain-containing protein, partial [Candidatus Obscuribacterales bacterium]|nr:TonB-dependent receptor plug domain-containing protein [Steroidobacteraceae bacterium]